MAHTRLGCVWVSEVDQPLDESWTYEDGLTNGNTKLRNVQKFGIDLLLRIADVLRFIVLKCMIRFIDYENRETKNRRKIEKSLNALNESLDL
ncbi:hypothetical protein V1477_013921 [Vespula maculifrons]|uniref:Uncharacterized protein n=1 Tax=Vespula maculifrons TaxID=7453 RepID=A0ABD2BQ75_VESMC